MAKTSVTDTAAIQKTRRNLSIMIGIVVIFIVVLYNLPGSRPPQTIAEGPLVMPGGVMPEGVMPEAASTAPVETPKAASGPAPLTAPELIAAADPVSHEINIEAWDTDKGAKVLFVQAPQIPMLDIRLVFNAGSARDGDTPGLAATTSNMLMEGAGDLDVDALAQHFEGLGAIASTGSYRDMAVVSLRSLVGPDYLEPALIRFMDVVSKPTFPSASLERTRAQMLLQLQQVEQDPGSLGSQRFFDTLYQGHPYGIHSQGTETSLKAITTADLKQFHQQYYTASNLVIAMIGAIDRSKAETIAERISQRLAAGKPAAELPNPAPLGASRHEHIEFPSQQTHISVGQLGVARGDEDLYALMVGNHILGSGGFSSRLNQVIRQDNGLAYSVYSQFSPMQVTGPFIMGLQTRNDQTAQALELLQNTLSDFMRDGPTAAELEHAKQNILGSFPLQTASNSNIVDYLGMIGFYDLPLDYLQQYPDHIEAVTIEAVKTAFARHVQPEQLLTVTVGATPANETPAQRTIAPTPSREAKSDQEANSDAETGTEETVE